MREIRRIATRLAQQQIHPAHGTVSSIWHHAHHAAAQQALFKSRMQL
jgi:hypothetical protein